MWMPKPPRWLVIAVAVVLMLAAWGYLALLGEGRRDVARFYGRYSRNYGSFDHEQSHEWASCYGETWDSYTDRVRADVESHASDVPYRRSRAAQFERLTRMFHTTLAVHP